MTSKRSGRTGPCRIRPSARSSALSNLVRDLRGEDVELLEIVADRPHEDPLDPRAREGFEPFDARLHGSDQEPRSRFLWWRTGSPIVVASVDPPASGRIVASAVHVCRQRAERRSIATQGHQREVRAELHRSPGDYSARACSVAVRGCTTHTRRSIEIQTTLPAQDR